MRTRIPFLIVAALLITALMSACSRELPELRDGYYTAEAAAFSVHGWKEYVTLYVSGNKILTVEYDAYNSSGFIRSWDMEYMRTMRAAAGTYPNEFTRTYVISLINWQNPDEVDAVSGATESHSSFQILIEAAIEKARAGDKQVALVELYEDETEH